MKPAIKKLGTENIQQFRDLILVFEEVFEMKNFKMPGDSHLQQLLEKDSFFVFVAMVNDKVIGGLTSYTMEQYYAELPLVYIFDLAVKNEFQRKGIGKMLMAALLDYCREIGVEEVFVQADLPDKHAIEFYRSTGGIAEEVIHFNYPL